MSNQLRKIRKNAEDFMLDRFYNNMTPEDYKKGIQTAIKITEDKLSKEYNEQLAYMRDKCNQSIREGVMHAMDTLTVEIIYELGKQMECYVDEPEYLDQKVDVVHNLYETAMKSIEDYVSPKYKNANQARKTFEKKKKIVQKYFGMTPSK